jgi:hypothetical protein
MNYRIFLILFIILGADLPNAWPQDGRYRVEALLLTHLNHADEPRELKWIKDYSQSTDFLTPPAPPEEELDGCEPETAVQDVPGAENAEFAPDGALPGDPVLEDGSKQVGLSGPEAAEEEAPPELDPNAVIPIEEMSDTMQEAWRLLRLSAPFRPEQYLSWEQGSNEPFPSLRLHDGVVVDTDDPYARARFERALAAEQALLESAQNDGAVQPVDDAPEPEDPCLKSDVEEAAEPALPDPTLFYRLDGSIMLRRSRFLHVDLDLQLREALFEEPADTPAAGSLLATRPEPEPQPDPAWLLNTEAGPAAVEFEEPVRPAAFRVHSLVQSRQVKTERMEYFDSPVMGVLLLITKIEAMEEPGPESP